MRSLKIAVSLAIILIPLYAQNYLWPIPASDYLSSTFGEFREGHFHSGIDIKTNYSTGYPVMAVAKGYIWRIRTSPYGYGKALYLMMDDGNIAVYGHLDRFNRRLESVVRTEQILQNRYSTDIYLTPDKMRVSQGDTLAFSGDTGTKHPHLHFEIRTPDNRPLNPLNTNLKIRDTTIPTIKEVGIVPLSRKSRIDGQPTIQTYPCRYTWKKQFTVDDTIYVHGPVGIEIKTHDTVRGIPNRYAPYGIRLLIEDSLLFFVQYDTLDFEETRLVLLDRDYQLLQRDRGHFNRLWIFHPDFRPTFYRQAPGPGVVDLPTGTYPIRIKVFDRNGNTSLLKMQFVSTPDWNAEIDRVHQIEGGYIITLALPDSGEFRPACNWISPEGVFRRRARLTSALIAKDSLQLTIKDTVQPNEVLKITLTKQSIGQQKHLYFNPEIYLATTDDPISLQIIQNPRTIICQLGFPRPPQISPTVFLQFPDQLKEIPCQPLAPAEYVTGPLPKAWLESLCAIEARYNTRPIAIGRYSVKLTLIPPDQPAIIFSEDSVLRVAYPQNSVYDTTAAWTTIIPLATEAESNLLSACYHLHPAEQPLRRPITLRFKRPICDLPNEKIGIYRLDDKEWDYQDKDRESDSFHIQASVLKNGVFALLKDTQPPEIKAIFPGNGGRFRSSSVKNIYASVEDQLSGIKDDTSIMVTLDGQRLIAEYHGVQHYIRYNLMAPLASGQHTLSIIVTDNAKNQTEKTSTFHILPD